MQTRTDANLFGADISEFQGTIDIPTMINEGGVNFIIFRATQRLSGGGFNTDDNFIANAQAARANGVPSGGYHFLRPTATITDAEAEADYFAGVLESAYGAGDYGDILPVVDFEVLEGPDGTINITDALDYVDHFRTYFFNTYGRKMLLYTGQYFVQSNNNFNFDTTGNPLQDMPLWIAAWERFGLTAPADVGGWTSWTIWQFTDDAFIEGVTSRFINQSVGTGDGSDTTFFLGNAPIRRSDLIIYFDGSEVDDSLYSVDYNTGEVTFDTAPANGVVITADFSAPAVDGNAGPTHIDYLLRPPTPDNVEVIRNDIGNQILTWDAVDAADLTAYNIYKDSAYHATVFTNEYTIGEIEVPTDYNVTAVDFYEESEPSETVQAVPALENIDNGFWGGRLEIDMVGDNADFNRDSSAYDAEGDFYFADEPRYNDGQSGFGEAYLSEEPTTNLVGSEGFLSVDTDENGIADGWSAYSTGTGAGTYSMNTTDTAFGQPASQRFEKTDGGADRFGITKTVSFTAGAAHSASILIYPEAIFGNATINIDWFTDAGGTYVTTTSVGVTFNSDFVRYDLVPVTSTVDTAAITIWLESANGILNVQIAQVEAKEFPTTFIETTRDRDVLSIPADGLLDPSGEGTISAWVDVNDAMRNAAANTYVFAHVTDTNNGYNVLALRYNVTSSEWQVWSRDATGTETILAVADVLSAGWHQFHVTYDQTNTTLELYIDGSLEDSDVAANLFDAVADDLYIGLYANGAQGNINTAMDNLVISSVAKDGTTIGNEYSSGAPVPADGNTLLVMNFDGNINGGGGGERITPEIVIPNATQVVESFVFWNEVLYPGTDITVESSLDGGSTWDPVTKGAAIPNATGDLSADSVMLRATLTADDSGKSPKLINLYWRLVYADGGGLLFPLALSEPGLEIVAFDVEQTINNTSDVSVPFFAVVRGEITNFTLSNETTGKEITLEMTVEAGERIEIDTRFGQKRITLIDANGVETNALPNLDIDVSEFWQLVPGPNVIRLDAATNVGGEVNFTWRPRKAGL